MIFESVSELAKALSTRKIGSEELLCLFIERIKKRNGAVNALISFDPEQALDKARHIDERRVRGDSLSSCAGIPIIHKDGLCTTGFPTTCGSKMLKDFLCPYDAHVVSILDEAGFVTLGKSNMDEFAMGSSNETSFFGPVCNPWDLNHVPGGSSGGSAAVVSAGFCPLSTGSDTGGSIRQPASFSGVTALKPTYGLVSRFGLIAFASSMDQVGPMARRAEDCAFLLEHMVGEDARDPTQVKRAPEPYFSDLMLDKTPLSSYRIGVIDNFFRGALDAPVSESVQSAIEWFAKQGATVSSVSLSHVNASTSVYCAVAFAELASNLARFDGVRYGFRSKEPFQSLEEFYCNTRAEGFGDEVKRRILIGNYVLSPENYERYYVQAQKVRRLIAEELLFLFRDYDALLAPTTPTTAFAFGSGSKDPAVKGLSDAFTIPANLAGLPAMSIPCGFWGRLPIGLQLIGPHFGEKVLFRLAHLFQQETDYHLRIPSGFS